MKKYTEGQLRTLVSTPNTSEICIEHADLGERCFKKLNFQQSNFEWSSFRKSRFEDCRLWGANFRWCDLQEVDFDVDSIGFADFRWSNLRNSDMTNIKFEGVNFYRANLEGVELHGSSFDGKVVLPTGEKWKSYIENIVPVMREMLGVKKEPDKFQILDFDKFPSRVIPRLNLFLHLFKEGVIGKGIQS